MLQFVNYTFELIVRVVYVASRASLKVIGSGLRDFFLAPCLTLDYVSKVPGALAIAFIYFLIKSAAS